MKKALIFGVGLNYRMHKQRYEREYEIVGLIDNHYDTVGIEGVKPVAYCLEAEYDCIVITTYEYQDMYVQLIQMGVMKQIIIDRLMRESWSYPRDILGYPYYGQHCDDLVIAAIFGLLGIEYPSYLDLGSNNPVGHSNTARMYACGCRGVTVDADAFWDEPSKKMRPEDTHLCVGVSVEEGESPFYSFGDGSGLNTLSKDEMQKWDRPLYGGVKNIKTTTLKKIVDKYFPKKFPDFLDCDVEGLDYEILSSYDLKSNGPIVICVEVRAKDIDIFDEMLDDKGYFRFCRIGENNIYVRKLYSMPLNHYQMDDVEKS